MAKRDIVFCGDPILRRKAKPIKEITPEVVELLADMAETMIEAPGVGLAAPQVGESVRAITVLECGDGEDRVHALINPRIVKRQGEEEGPEGCLSLPTLQGMVTRAAKVKAEGLDVEGNRVQIEAEGLLARALQHEIDHLNGVLFIDTVDLDTLGWLVPDQEDEDGYALVPTTREEAVARFAQMLKKAGAR
jgi:peptide deformylase